MDLVEQCRKETEDHILLVTQKATILAKALNEAINKTRDIDTAYNIGQIVGNLVDSVLQHDASKLQEPELGIFAEVTPLLKGSTYGSQDYKAFLEKLGPALKHHYENNSHHPEHYENGIAGMCLVDLLEMFCDWLAAVERHTDGDIYRSIEINEKRFDMPAEIVTAFKNTLELYGLRRGAPRKGMEEPADMDLVEIVAAFAGMLANAQSGAFLHHPARVQEGLEAMIKKGYPPTLISIFHNTLKHFDGAELRESSEGGAK